MSFLRYLMKLSILILILSLLLPASAQDNSPQNNNNESAGISGSTTETESEVPADTDTLSGRGQVIETIIIQGSVVREDGSPPPFGTVIERECGADVTNEILVDGNGYFSFILGDENRHGGLLVDASENLFSNPYRDIRQAGDPESNVWSQDNDLSLQLFGCLVRARFDGFHSTEVQLGTDQKSGLIDVGTLVIYPRSRVKGTVVSVTNLKAPKAAQESLKEGKKALEKNELDNAEKHYLSALELYPDYSEAWVELGWLHQKQERNDEARKAYLEASKADKNYISPYIRLAQLSALEQKWKQSAEYSSKAILLDPISYPQAYFLNALSYYNMGQLEQAESIVQKGIRLDLTRQIPKIYLVHSNILIQKGDFPGAMDAMRQYLYVFPDAPDAEDVRSRIRALEERIRADRTVDKNSL